MEQEIKKKKGLVWKIILGVVLLLFIALHFILEPVALRYANKALAELEGYRGHIDDIGIRLYRGAYQIQGLEIVAVNDKDSTESPFFKVDIVDISIEWKALFKGSVVGEFTLTKPIVNFKKEPGGEVQAGGENDFVEVIQDLIPIQINRFEIIDGEVHFLDPTASPPVNVFVLNLNGIATNLSNVNENNDPLPSRVDLNGSTIGDGTIRLGMGLNALKAMPDFDLELELAGVRLTALDAFTEAYANFTFKDGTLYTSSEIAMKDGDFEGYVKPVLENFQVIDMKNEETTFLRKMWEVVIGSTLGVFQNQRTDRFATQVPFEGSTKNTRVRIIPTVFNVLKNAFIEAFEKDVEGSVNFQGLGAEKEKDDGLLKKIFNSSDKKEK